MADTEEHGGTEAVWRNTIRLALLSMVVGVLAGVASAAFLSALDWATDERFDHPSLLYLLPLAGLAVGLVYHYGGGRSAEGNNLIIDEIHDPKAWVPRRMAPMIFVGTVLTQLFGGSAGREGAAIQMSGSLTDLAARTLRVAPRDRRVLLVAAIAGGFGAVFGVPLAGAVFGLEVQRRTRDHGRAVLPCLVAALVGDRIVAWLGVHHTPTPDLGRVDLSVSLLAKVALGAVAFGLISTVFSIVVHAVKWGFGRTIGWAPGRPFVGGLLVIALTLLFGTRVYNGLSLGLIEASLFGAHVPTWGFAAKLLLTAVTLGAGFVGGEVTPLFVIGATLGATLAGVLDVPLPLLAALGFVAVFAGAANTPIACVVMGLELFGTGAAAYFVVACAFAYLASSHRGLYGGADSATRSPVVPWAFVAFRHRRPVAEIP
ncbi:voltage-gated chloride channel family protein [soil metagenome]